MRTDFWYDSKGAGKIHGCRWIPELGEYRFVVWAPNAQAVSLTGDFNVLPDSVVRKSVLSFEGCGEKLRADGVKDPDYLLGRNITRKIYL